MDSLLHRILSTSYTEDHHNGLFLANFDVKRAMTTVKFLHDGPPYVARTLSSRLLYIVPAYACKPSSFLMSAFMSVAHITLLAMDPAESREGTTVVLGRKKSPRLETESDHVR